MVGRGNVFEQPGPTGKWGIFIWVKKGDVYLEKEEQRVSGIRREKCIWG